MQMWDKYYEKLGNLVFAAILKKGSMSKWYASWRIRNTIFYWRRKGGVIAKFKFNTNWILSVS
jgi:hypothetical protein